MHFLIEAFNDWIKNCFYENIAWIYVFGKEWEISNAINCVCTHKNHFYQNHSIFMRKGVLIKHCKYDGDEQIWINEKKENIEKCVFNCKEEFITSDLKVFRWYN